MNPAVPPDEPRWMRITRFSVEAVLLVGGASLAAMDALQRYHVLSNQYQQRGYPSPSLPPTKPTEMEDPCPK